ncbi:MAG: apolipoprotein N-acyltransferase [Saprospiraceae bacterium]|nr:apolipoprotein N-acyltransferase [Saprospiraceae bacterium]
MKKRLAFIIGLGCLLVFGITSWSMYALSQEELLWGYRPLLFYLSLWGAVISFLYPNFSKLPNKRNLLLLSTLSGVLLGVGFPDIIPVPFLMLVGFIPLLLVEESISQQQPKRSAWESAKYAYHAFVVWNIVATYWVGNASLGAGGFAIWVNALLMSIPFVLFHLTKKTAARIGLFSLAAYWLTFEYLHLNWDLTWPWLTLGNSFAEYPALVQWYEYTGVFGGSLWIWLMNIWIYQMYQYYKEHQKMPVLSLIRNVFFLLVPMAISLYMYANYEEKGEAAEVVVVQPNYEPHYVKFSVSERNQVEHFLELAREQVDDNTDFLVFPESSFGTTNGYVRINNIEQNPSIRSLRAFAEEYPNLKIVTGINAYYIFEDNEVHSKAVRERELRNGDIMYYESINGAIQISADTDTIPVYRKSKLVPGPEKFPFPRLLFFMKPVVDKLGGTTAGVASQEDRSTFVSNSGNIAPAICYESVFGEFFSGYLKKRVETRAELAFIMTNDGWWDETAGHRQHLLFGALRAIETRRSIARAANTGISCFINQRGDVLQATNYDEAAVIKASLKKNQEITFYVLMGDSIARICMFLSIIFLLNIFVKRRMPEKK